MVVLTYDGFVREAAMPFKSQAQRRKFAELLVAGKISPETFEEWNRETGSKRLPEHVKRKATSLPRPRTAKASRTRPKSSRRKSTGRRTKR
jgi:hypothetical protein